MDSNYKPYDYLASFARLDALLAAPTGNFEEVQSLPDRDRLTYTNGFYAYCAALFVDIRGSSRLPDKYLRPALARLYRAYISEMVAVMNASPQTREVNIVGDGVWAVFNTPYKSHIDEVFLIALRAHSLVRALNYKMKRAGYDEPLAVGIGMAYGRALMIKAGYSGSGIADVVYMGDVVNRAAKLASQGSKNYFTPPVMIDDVFASNLSDVNSAFIKWDYSQGCHTSSAVNAAMEEWLQAQPN